LNDELPIVNPRRGVTPPEFPESGNGKSCLPVSYRRRAFRRSATRTTTANSTTAPPEPASHHGSPAPDRTTVAVAVGGVHVERAFGVGGADDGTLTPAYRGPDDAEPLTVRAISNVGCVAGTVLPSVHTGLSFTAT
jgi:hypothetical protein